MPRRVRTRLDRRRARGRSVRVRSGIAPMAAGRDEPRLLSSCRGRSAPHSELLRVISAPATGRMPKKKRAMAMHTVGAPRALAAEARASGEATAHGCRAKAVGEFALQFTITSARARHTTVSVVSRADIDKNSADRTFTRKFTRSRGRTCRSRRAPRRGARAASRLLARRVATASRCAVRPAARRHYGGNTLNIIFWKFLLRWRDQFATRRRSRRRGRRRRRAVLARARRGRRKPATVAFGLATLLSEPTSASPPPT